MRRLALLLVLFVASVAFAADVPEYQAIRASRPDGRVVTARNLVLTRDAYRLEFRSGAFHLLAPFGGTTFGAVFVGDGSYTLTPATSGELHHLQLASGKDDLTQLADHFDEMVLLFTDQTAAEIEAHAPVAAGTPDARAVAVYEDYLKQQRQQHKTNVQLRVLMDLLNRPDRTDGLFVAFVKGKTLAPALLVVDPLGVSNFSAMYSFFGGEEVGFFSFDNENRGFWYLATFREQAKNGRGKPPRPLADAQNYDISTTINGLKIDGTTRVRLQPVVPGIRILPIRLMPKLRISGASLAGGGELGVVQEPLEPSRLQRLLHDEVVDADAAVVFPQPLDEGKPVEIEIRYGGDDVLQAYGAQFFSVRARESWYPNLGTFTDLATYSLTFNAPRRNEVVAVGDKVDDRTDAGRRITTWRAGTPIRVAGFNYGDFVKISRNDPITGITVDVYTNREWTKKADDTLVDALNATRSSMAYFGPMPYKHLSVTQQLESFGQSWPTLVYFPTLALTTGAERAEWLGANPGAMSNINEFVKMVGWHEVAHQWWGHRVGWESYRDQWLSEGFAEFSAAVTLQYTENFEACNRFWENQRQEILRKSGPTPNWQAGALTDGYRSNTRYSPGSAQALIYEKGGYVLHMLRMLMRDNARQNQDELFIAMMKDFVQTYDGKNPSSNDFQRVVEKHMTPAMNAAGNFRMDWFFDQWVYGRSVPRLKSALQATATTAGKYRISGTVAQEGVPDDFITLVPIYLDFGGGNVGRLALLKMIGTKTQTVDAEVPLPSAPRRVTINMMHDVLARD